MKLFWVDQTRDASKTYADLAEDLAQRRTFPKYIQSDDPYEVFLNVLLGMMNEAQIVLLDADMSDSERQKLSLEEGYASISYENIAWQSAKWAALIEQVPRETLDWQITMFTSGTTGRPKRVSHFYRTLARQVRRGEKHAEDVWGFAYNPVHFAGMQVFLQALFNGNTLINLFDANRTDMDHLIAQFQITHISATSTFYRTIAPYFERVHPGVRRLTVGGEKFDRKLSGLFAEHFPNAKITNVYASTEAGSLFAGQDDQFVIPDDMKSLVKIAEDGELMVHASLLGQFGTAPSADQDAKWYRTGDLVQWTGEGRFRFVSRKTEMINIGGYKVNPHEVEEEIMRVDGVSQVLVRPRENRITGNLLVADVVKSKEVSEKELERRIIRHLKERLQYWKLPRMIHFVEKLELTKTGKKVRH